MMIREHRGGSLWNLPDVLQFMQLLWAVIHGLEADHCEGCRKQEETVNYAYSLIDIGGDQSL